MKIRVVIAGREIILNTPNEDLEIHISDDDVKAAAPSTQQFKLGKVQRQVLNFCFEKRDPDNVAEVFTREIERVLGLTTIAIGRSISSLVKLGFVKEVERKKTMSGQVLSYTIRLDAKAIEASREAIMENVLDSIRESIGDEAATLMMALVSLADIDGNVVIDGDEWVRAIKGRMDPIPDRFPMADFEVLAEDGWISVADAEDSFKCKILNWEAIKGCSKL